MTKRVLIVDDDDNIRFLLEQILEEIGGDVLELMTARDGEEALEIANAVPLDLMFLDVMMPKKSGFDVCRTIKQDRGMTDTYIILVTAKGQGADKQKGKEVGADLYITKPFDPDAIVKKTSEVLGL